MLQAVRKLVILVVVVALILVGLAPVTAGVKNASMAGPSGQDIVDQVWVSPPAVGPQGGTVVINASLAGANNCHVVLTSSQGFKVQYPHGTDHNCPFSYHATVVIGPNPTPDQTRLVSFNVIVNGNGEHVSVPVVIGLYGTEHTPFLANNSAENWSGYAVQGGPFTHVAATFAVPYGAHNDCSGYLGQWVGIDGYNNDDLIQAGIAEDDISPSGVGNCTQLQINAWWEILPGPEMPIKMKVDAGDIMTVSITKLSHDKWAISIVDDTSGANFYHVFPYDGPESSAEWIMESPLVFGMISALLPYGTAKFTDLQETGPVMEYNDVWLAYTPQDIRSVPQIVTSFSALMADGFTVVYTG